MLDEPLSRECPECHAAVGMPCVWAEANPIELYHPARLPLATGPKTYSDDHSG